MVIASLVICGLHQRVVLNCTLDFIPLGLHVIEWTINNVSASEFEGVDTTMLNLNCTQTFEGSTIQCKRRNIFNRSDPDVLGDVYHIQIQGVVVAIPTLYIYL